MSGSTELHQRLKDLMVESLMLQIPATDIGDDTALFGLEGLGLDSVDALQLVVMLDKHFGLKVPDPDTAREILRSVRTMAEAVAAKDRPA